MMRATKLCRCRRGSRSWNFFQATHEPHAISELDRALGKSRNQIYQTMIVLRRLGHLARTDNDRFLVTRKLFVLAVRAPQRNLFVKAPPVMERLSAETFQSCHLMVAGPDMVVVESPDLLGFAVRVGIGDLSTIPRVGAHVFPR